MKKSDAHSLPPPQPPEPSAETYILGVDPGLRITGYGVIKLAHGTQPVLCEAGVIRAPTRKDLPARVAAVYDGISELLRAFQPAAVALEEIFSHYARPRTAILMGHARGVICLAVAQAGIPLVAYTPTQVKRLLTGSGRAGKGQIQRAVQRELGLTQLPQPPDVADALALALCHAYLLRKRDLVEAALHSRCRNSSPRQ